MRLLDSTNEEGRVSGTVHLLAWGKPAVPLVLEALPNEGSRAARKLSGTDRELVRFLTLMGDRRALPVLEKMLEGQDGAGGGAAEKDLLKKAITQVAGGKKSAAVLADEMRDLLRSRDEASVLEGLKRFAQRPEPSVAPVVEELAKTKGGGGAPTVRQAARRVLWTTGRLVVDPEDVPFLVRFGAAGDRKALDAVLRLGEQAVPHTLPLIQADDEKVSAAALAIVNRIKSRSRKKR